jgi:hypothetical protein
MLGLKALHVKVPTAAVPKYIVTMCGQFYTTLYYG